MAEVDIEHSQGGHEDPCDCLKLLDTALQSKNFGLKVLLIQGKRVESDCGATRATQPPCSRGPGDTGTPRDRHVASLSNKFAESMAVGPQ
jgi:hypothetical protein